MAWVMNLVGSITLQFYHMGGTFMPNDLLEPLNDAEPWGEDFEGDEVQRGDEGWMIDSEFVPNDKAKMVRYFELNGNRVNTEE